MISFTDVIISYELFRLSIATVGAITAGVGAITAGVGAITAGVGVGDC
jgi:hypothetical protein